MKYVIKIIAVGVLFMGANRAMGQGKPNIVFIFADDLSYQAVGAYGNEEVRTPTIDALAEQGVKFTRAYNMGSWSGAVCVPSRTMLNTGRYMWNAKASYSNDYSQLRKRNNFWSQKLKQAGYETYFTGKWHVPGLDPHRLFDHVVHIRPGMPNQTEAGYNRPMERQDDRWSPYDTTFGGYWKGGTHWSEVLANDAIHFIEQASGRDKPFFMYLAFNAAHDPRQSPKEFVDMYDPAKLTIPPNFLPEYPYKEPMGAGENLRDERLAPFPRTKYAVRIHRQEYYALITHMDRQISHIFDALKAKGEFENTIIVFTADHGLAVGQHGLMGKQNMFEHSLRVPFIITGPDIPSGKSIETPIYLQDVAPTTIELAGGQVPASYQFKSFMPLIRGEQYQLHPAIYGAYKQRQRAVMEWPYKLILYPTVGEVLLFNLAKDPYEQRNLASKAEVQPIIRSLMEHLIDLQKDNGDTLNIRRHYKNVVF